MQYTTIVSSDAVRAAGLPFTVARVHPREVVAAFRNEEDALAFKDQLNEPELDHRPGGVNPVPAETNENLFKGL